MNWNRKRNVLRYIDDAELVLLIRPDFPEYRRNDIPSMAFAIRSWIQCLGGLLILDAIGFKFAQDIRKVHG